MAIATYSQPKASLISSKPPARGVAGRFLQELFLTGLDQPLAMLLTRIGLSTTNAITAAMMLKIAAT